jgi:RHS repeat-associated protein
LNLPTKIVFPTGNIVYIYNASGQKVQKVVTENTTVTTTDYLVGYQYKNAVLQFFPTTEGYVKNTANVFSYVFNYTDHLGNVKLSYTKNPSNNALTILDENNYYPFGLMHKGYNNLVSTNNPAEKLLFNGKELQDELGLNVYDYGARNYEPALGRWMNIDPLADKGRRWSPYNYAMDNPVFFIDPDGMQALAGDVNNPNQMVPFEREGMGIHFIGGDGPGDPPKNYVPSPGFPGSNSPMELDEVVINTKDPYEGTYFDKDNKGSGEYGPSSIDFDFGLSSLFNWFSDNQSGYVFNDGEMKSDFIGDKIGKDGVLYGVTQNPWSPGTEVNNFNPIPLLKDAKTFSDLFSTQLEIAGTLKDARNTTSSETKRDSITESFMVNMKGDLQIRADSPKQRDSLINSPNGTTSWYSLKK